MKGNNYHLKKELTEDRIIRYIDQSRIKKPIPRWEGVFKVPLIELITHKAATTGKPAPALGWSK